MASDGTPLAAPLSGLVLHRYTDAAERDVGAPPSRVLHTRRYDVVDAEPNRLTWHETADFDTVSQIPPPASGVETMTFQLMCDVGETRMVVSPWLYVVHTDVPDDIVGEYNSWYDQEHLPRLVRVPGIIRARRYASPTGHPRYLTAYELEERESFSSPAAMQARKTPWTERMRSLFTNTRRFTGQLIT